MSLDRALLGFSGVFVLLGGLVCGLAPEVFAQQAGLAPTPDGVTEIRAFYGGMQVGLGCFLLWCLRQGTLIHVGLLAVAVPVAGVGLFRVLGMLLDQTITSYHIANLAIEVTTVAAVLLVTTRQRRMAEA